MPRSMNTAEKKLMLRIDTAANLEKASKLQSNRGVDLTGANLNASRRSQQFLNSNKKFAASIHVDCRGAATQQSNRLNKRVSRLETMQYKLRNKDSGSEDNNKRRKFMINELRLERQKLDSIFDTIKSEIVHCQNGLKDLFTTANQTFEARAVVVKEIKLLHRQERADINDHNEAVDVCNQIIENEVLRAKANESKAHKEMLEEKKARRAAKQRANNTFSDKKKSKNNNNNSDLEASYNRGALSDEQERNMKERIANLEAEHSAEAKGLPGPRGDQMSTAAKKEQVLATLHHLRHARRNLLLNARQAAQHTDRTVNTMSNEEHNNIMEDKNTVPDIITAWQENEKVVFDLVSEVQEINDEINEAEAEVELLKRKTKRLQFNASNQDTTKIQKTKDKRKELEVIEKKRYKSKQQCDKLKNDIDALCHGVENILVSTNLQSGSSDNEQTVKPFSLTKFAGVMEQRAIEICSAFRVWQEMTKDQSFMNNAKFSSTVLPPLPSHKKYKTLHGPNKRKTGYTYSSPLRGNASHTSSRLSTLEAVSDTPLTVKEMRLLFNN